MPFRGILPQVFPHRSTGATLVSFGSVANDGTTSLMDQTLIPIGYAEDRIEISERPQWEDIHNDTFGGMAGVPSEIQFLGLTALVQCNINRFDEENIKALASIHPEFSTLIGGIGNIDLPPLGTFMRQGNNVDVSYLETLMLSAPNETMIFYKAFLRHGRRFNMSVRHQQIMLVFECHVFSPCDMSVAAYDAPVNPCTNPLEPPVQHNVADT